MKIGGIPCQFLPLDSRTDRSRAAGDGAFGFDELGLFGVRKPLQSGASEPAAKSSTPEAAPARELDDARRANYTPADIEAAAPVLSSSHQPEFAVNEASEVQMSRPAPGLASNEPGSIGEIPIQQPEREFEPERLATNGSRMSEPARQGRAAQAMIVADKNGTIDIAIKAPPLDGEGRALLRRLLRQVLSERQLSLGDLMLNGVPLEADFLSMTGVSHGPRAR